MPIMARNKTGVLGKINPNGSAKRGVVSPIIKWTGITLLVFLFTYFAIITMSNFTPSRGVAEPEAQPTESQ